MGEPMPISNSNVDVFNRDATRHGGYLYTATGRLSSRLATERSTRAVLALQIFAGKRVLDIGCGDGFFALRYWDRGQAASWEGVDPASEAVAVANRTKGARPMTFRTGDGHSLPYGDNSFDVALLQSILHHDDNPLKSIREAFRVAPIVVIHEPNGFNLVLKVLEKVSPYHREHNEKSYTARLIRSWVRDAGGRTVSEQFAGLVPMFSPDWLARTVKRFEPLVEEMPIVRQVGCAVYVSLNQRNESGV